MAEKRGQITIFMIIGLVVFILVLMAYIIALSREKIEITSEKILPVDVKPIRAYLEECFENLGKSALMFVGSQGGYYILPDGFDYNDVQAGFHYYNGIIIPPISVIEQELSSFVDDFANSCLIDMDGQGFEITTGQPKTETTIGENEVTFIVDPDITLSKEGVVHDLEPFYTIVKPTRLTTIYDVSKAITEEIAKDPETICISCLVDLAERYNLKIDINPVGNKNMLFTIIDYTIDMEDPYIFNFAVKLK